MTAAPRLRSWFLRNLLEAADRELGPGALAGLASRAPARVRPHLSLDRLRTTAALDAVPLDEGEDALLAIDQGLGDGTGRLLERLAREMFARQLVQAAAAVRVGDLYGTVARLRVPLEHPFVDVELTFELERNESGFTLVVGVPGRPRATRLLRHVAVGAILAAERFARESQAEPLRVHGETFADRARIEAHFRRTSDVPPPFEPSPTSARRPNGSARLTQPSLSDEVARILDPSLSLGRARAEQQAAPKRISSSEMEVVKPPPQSDAALGPAAPASQRQPTVPPPAATPAPEGARKSDPVDPRGVTLPALRRASSKPPKA
ncbi:MAG TPA: hypothetical protein VFZ53_06270 [Polyangiaceae bacterium]